MSILAGPTRYSRSMAGNVADLITWREEEPGTWTGAIDLDYAGRVDSENGRFHAFDWNDSPVGEFRTLCSAKQALEPRRRMVARDREERHALRTQWAITGAAAVTAAAALVVLANGALLGS